ncbi:MAG: HAD-IIIA family hydrolase [Sphingobium sp.]|nr:HAD-IIIA family hydrolase [Sphingobium sp.]
MDRSARQLAVLVGGKGTRLGVLSQATPKPLMPIDEGRVFLDFLLEGMVRQGITHVLMVAGHFGEQIVSRYAHRNVLGADIDVIVEPEPMGTGGALRLARPHLADNFFLMNGDTIFDANIRKLEARLRADDRLQGVMALRRVPDVGRYGSVETDQADRVVKFLEKDPSRNGVEGLINGGIYVLRKGVIDLIPDRPTSLETEILPVLAKNGVLAGIAAEGYFLDIGLPEALEQARTELPQRSRPVLFLDRDGVVNVDHGHVGSIDRWEWAPGAVDLIRAANDHGVAVVLVTNQAGIAKGYYAECDVWALHHHVSMDLHRQGAFIDAVYYCPEHADAVSGAYRVSIPIARKPSSVMLSRALRQQNLNPSRALLVGDQISDIEAASALSIPALLYKGGRVDDLVFASKEWARLIEAGGEFKA